MTMPQNKKSREWPRLVENFLISSLSKNARIIEIFHEIE